MSKSLKTPFLPGMLEDAPPLPGGVRVGSELITYENRSGKRIVGFHDFPKSINRDQAWMIVLPGYGETKSEVLATSYFLARNDFHVLRFDYSDHVGESDGDIRTTTLTKIKEDIFSALDYLYRRHQPTAVGVIGSSLACRALLRAAVEDDRISMLMNLVSIVDLRKTLFEIYQEDHLGRALKGLPNGVMDVLGFQVDADNFLHSAIQDRYENLATTIEDVRQIKAPMVFFAAEKDAWVDIRDVQEVFAAAGSPRKYLHVIEGAMHRLYENPDIAKEALRSAVGYAVRHLTKPKRAFLIHEPNLREIGARIRQEKERSRILRGVSKDEEREFWKTYLEKYSFIINVHDYWNLLDFIDRVLGEPKSGERILDAGCGIGNYGTFLLLRLIYRIRQSLIPAAEPPQFFYVALDFVKEAIAQAQETHRHIQSEFTKGLGWYPDTRPAAYDYLLGDLETTLPFKSGSFGQICCNLVISYLQDPQKVVAGLVRVLKPKGRIVLSSLKPFADLSQVYRNFVQVAKTQQEIEEARRLLSNAGRVMAKEAEGIYRFFSEEELTDLLKEAGVSGIETYRSLGKQANVAVGVKG
jgi:SAM-dependent methyltransferase/esterase/lipase